MESLFHANLDIFLVFVILVAWFVSLSNNVHDYSSFCNQIFSHCNIYEAGQKKLAFKYLTEKASAYTLLFTEN